jgi:hypothetical protein
MDVNSEGQGEKLMGMVRSRQLTAILLALSLLLSFNSVWAHEGQGDPIIADVEIAEEDIAPNEQVELRFKLFSLKAIEEKDSETADFIIKATVNKGEESIQIATVKSTENEFVGTVVFPTAGTWTLNAHLQKAGNELDSGHHEPPVYTTEIEVRPVLSSLWKWAISIAAIILFAAFAFRKRSWVKIVHRR